jgi:hypothetical protein
MTVSTLIQQLQENAEPNDEVFLIIEDGYDHTSMQGCVTGIDPATKKTGKCEIYSIV